jgi:tetratricopeptide (TPR) repeat protein
MHLTLSLLLLAGLPASAQTPSTTSAAATATDQTVLLLLGAAWAASSEAELAAREADASVLMDGIRAGMTGVVTTGEDKSAMLILMARYELYESIRKFMSDDVNTEGSLKKARRLHEQLRQGYPEAAQRHDLACEEWLIAMLESNLDTAQEAAERALSAAADPVEGALARLLRAEVHAARGEQEAARALYAEAAAVPSAVPALIRYRLVAVGGTVSTAPLPDPTGPAPHWLLGAEEKLREGRIP